MPEKKEEQTQVGEAQKKESKEKTREEENLILGRFKSEDELKQHLESLESKKAEEEREASMTEILDFKRPEEKAVVPEKKKEIEDDDEDEVPAQKARDMIRDVIKSEIGPLKAELQRSRDEQDAARIMQYPNYKKYVQAAKDKISRSPHLTLLEAFSSVYDVIGEMKNHKPTEAETPGQEDALRQKKISAQVETGGTIGGPESATDTEADQIKKFYGFSPGDDNKGRRV